MAQVVVLVGADRKAEELLGKPERTVVFVPESEIAARRPSKADVFVIDVRGRDHLPPSVASITREVPAAGFVLLVSALDPVLMLEAMRAGVRECIPEPIAANDVDAAIERVGAFAGAQGEVFAFVGAKGGVGTTTTAVNVAIELAAGAPKQTLLMDLHMSNGDAAVFLAEEPRFTVADAIENAHRLDEAVLRTLVVRTKNHLDLLGSPDLRAATHVEPAGIRSVIDFAARNYRFTVLDVPRSEPAALDALQATARVVIVANQELATVRSASRLAAMLRQRYGKDRMALALTRYDPNAEIGEADISRAVGLRVSYLLPSDYRRAVEALNSGTPLSLGNHSRLAASFKALARDLAGSPTTERDTATSAGLFARLMGRRNN